LVGVEAGFAMVTCCVLHELIVTDCCSTSKPECGVIAVQKCSDLRVWMLLHENWTPGVFKPDQPHKSGERPRLNA
jgi:hypothetical protein